MPTGLTDKDLNDLCHFSDALGHRGESEASERMNGLLLEVRTQRNRLAALKAERDQLRGAVDRLWEYVGVDGTVCQCQGDISCEFCAVRKILRRAGTEPERKAVER